MMMVKMTKIAVVVLRGAEPEVQQRVDEDRSARSRSPRSRRSGRFRLNQPREPAPGPGCRAARTSSRARRPSASTDAILGHREPRRP